MSDTLEQLLAQGLDRLTAEAELPAGVAARAQAAERRHHRRLAATVAGTAGAAAAVTAAAALTIGSGAPAGGPDHPSPAATARVSTGQALTTAYVIPRVVRAVTAQSAARPVLSIRTVFTGHEFPRDTGNPAGTVQLGWTRGYVYRTATFGPDGKLTSAARSVISGVAIKTLDVNYRSRTWSVDHGAMSRGLAGRACLSQPSPVPDCPGSVASQIRHAVAAGKFHVAGKGVVDGIKAIRLTESQSTGICSVGTHHRCWTGVERQSLWVAQMTFLPLRWTTTTNIPKLESYRTQQDRRWLPPTKANLSHLRLTIPKGYHFT